MYSWQQTHKPVCGSPKWTTRINFNGYHENIEFMLAHWSSPIVIIMTNISLDKGGLGHKILECVQ